MPKRKANLNIKQIWKRYIKSLGGHTPSSLRPGDLEIFILNELDQDLADISEEEWMWLLEDVLGMDTDEAGAWLEAGAGF